MWFVFVSGGDWVAGGRRIRTHANMLKTQFIQNWQLHYWRLNQLIKNLYPSEFIELIKSANQQRIWEYAELEEYQLPYVLVTLADFKPQTPTGEVAKKYARKYWFRCWFDSSVECYDDLWIERQQPLEIWVAWYELTTNSKKTPRAKDLKGSYSNQLNNDFLNASPSFPATFVQKIEKELESLLK